MAKFWSFLKVKRLMGWRGGGGGGRRSRGISQVRSLRPEPRSYRHGDTGLSLDTWRLECLVDVDVKAFHKLVGSGVRGEECGLEVSGGCPQGTESL